MLRRIVPTLAVLGALFCGQVQALPTLELDPIDGALSGLPGATVGWGFTLSNDADSLVVTGASFSAPVSVGSFTDYISQHFFVVGPPPEISPVSQAFDPSLMTGIGSFAIDSNAPIGAVVNSAIVLTYDLYSVSPHDPAFNPDTDTLSTGNILTADASVRVIPEPAPLLLFMAGFFALMGRGYLDHGQKRIHEL